MARKYKAGDAIWIRATVLETNDEGDIWAYSGGRWYAPDEVKPRRTKKKGGKP